MNNNARPRVSRARHGPSLTTYSVSDRERRYAGKLRSDGITGLASWNRTADIPVNAPRTSHSRRSAELC